LSFIHFKMIKLCSQFILHPMKKEEFVSRVVIESLSPVVEAGLYPAKRIQGETVWVEANVFADGHDLVRACLQYRKQGNRIWKEHSMKALGNDRWTASFRAEQEGTYEFAVKAWIDLEGTWLDGFVKKAAAGESMQVEIAIGLNFLEKMKGRTARENAFLNDSIRLFRDESRYLEAISVICGESFKKFFEQLALPKRVNHSPVYRVWVEPKKAMFSAWYEFFPRSATGDKSRHGTFRDCEKVLQQIAEWGFDTVYFPPIHPIGESFRKGKNNNTKASKGEPGSPWAIGHSSGGHKSLHPELGDFKDFEHLTKTARELGLEIALDLAYQCSPDHPYVKDFPQWFSWRPDGTVQYAENPPKKYQDVLPFHFECDDWRSLWEELKSIVEFWIDKGIRIFRVDNPHTKPFPFWKWLMEEMRKKHPQVIFLSEAFTRPSLMAQLARIGFQQSYTYFTWRESKQELEQYMQELCTGEGRNFFRPNFWPNTPDILPYYLQNSGNSMAAIRLILASTLSASYGIYGPVYEMLENKPLEGKEEYADSEKYEIRQWDWKAETPLRKLYRRINRIRNENEAFHDTFNYVPCRTDNDKIMAYFKASESNKVFIVVNLDPHHKQSGWVQMPLKELHSSEGEIWKMEDLLNDRTYHWDKEWNYVELDPENTPAHIFKIHPFNRELWKKS